MSTDTKNKRVVVEDSGELFFADINGLQVVLLLNFKHTALRWERVVR